jgi:threonine synthase
MLYYSTNRQSPPLDFKAATILGQPPDKGLYFPESIPVHGHDFFEQIEKYSPVEIGLRILRPYVGDAIPEAVLEQIIAETLAFPIPLVPVTDRIHALELYHGPTLAFKDVGARFMSRCLGHFVQGHSAKVVVLVATSGDTGGAVAHGFYNVPGIEVVILYPSGKVSAVQEKQLTTLGGNIRALEVKGSFDDCQRMVKTAFTDTTITEHCLLTSANSINIARWLPQQLYYLLAWQQWPDKAHPPVVAVPSGNFGNLCAGVLARVSGLPVAHFIAACNANDVVPRFQQTGEYKVLPAIPTLSNAMDVGDPSNFVRILECLQQDTGMLWQWMSSTGISDEETRATIHRVFTEQGYLTDPHGAVAFLALQRYLAEHPGKKGIFLETAHPVKFNTTVEAVTGEPVVLPDMLRDMMTRPSQRTVIGTDYAELKEVLLQ